MEKFAKAIPSCIVILAVAVVYSVVRYHIFKGEPWDHFPLYIFNKSISLAAVSLIALSYMAGPLTRLHAGTFSFLLPFRKYYGLLGFGLAAVHIIMSLLIFSQAYYPKFFEESGKLNLTGELSMLFGVLALFIFFLVAISSLPSVASSMTPKDWGNLQRQGYLALAVVMLHVFVMGYEGWLRPEGWPGRLLPISLIAFSIIAFTLLLRVVVSLFPVKDQS